MSPIVGDGVMMIGGGGDDEDDGDVISHLDLELVVVED